MALTPKITINNLPTELTSLSGSDIMPVWDDSATTTARITVANFKADQVTPDITNLQSQIDLKAPLASPVFTGNPQVPTATTGDASQSAASTQFVTDAINSASGAVVSVNGDTGAVTVTPTSIGAYTTTETDGLITDLKNEMEINVLDYGAVGDGVTDDRAAILAAIAAANGRTVYFPGRTYGLGSVLGITVSQHVRLKLDPAAVLYALPGFAAGQKVVYFLNSTVGLGLRAYIEGGKIDSTNQPNSAPGEANDTLGIVGQAYTDLVVRDVQFYSGPTRTSSSDTGIFVASCQNVMIEKCRFQGFPDNAVYVSGDGTGAYGTDLNFCDNRVYECTNGIIFKRQWRRMTMIGNHFTDCDTGISCGEADTSQLPGEYLIATNNQFKRVRQPILARISNSFIVSNNTSVDHGYNSAGVSVANQAAYTVQGSARGIVSGNVAIMKDYATYSTQSGIRLERRTFNAINYDCSNNLVYGNSINAIYTGIYEDANSSNNVYFDNSITNFTNRLSLNGTNPTVRYTDPAGVYGQVINAKMVSLAGDYGSESLRATRVANAVNYINTSGSIASNSAGPIMQATGSDVTVPLTILSTGANMYLNGIPGEETLRLAAGVSAGNCFQMTPAAAGSDPVFAARGADTNINLQLSGKGTGVVKSDSLYAVGTTQVIYASSSTTLSSPSVSLGAARGAESLRVDQTASAVNFVNIRGAATAASSGVTIGAGGTDTDIAMTISGKGAGLMFLGGNAGSEALRISPGVASGNCHQFVPAAAASMPYLTARGADTNIDMWLKAKGTGNIRFGTWTSSADTAVNGYITVKDDAGNTRKIATIA